MSSQSLLDRLKPVVDRTIELLANTEFRLDPIGGERYSRATSIVSSAYKRHGQIIEAAVLERLKDCSYFDAWREPEFYVSAMADQATSTRNANIEDSLPIELPYGHCSRTIQVDAIVFDERIGSIRAYEIKRGNGHFDAGKKRSILRDISATQALLKGYAQTKGFKPSFAEARVIAYYGIKPLPDPLSIAGCEMDDHFVFPVFHYVEEVNDYFKTRLYALLEQVTGIGPEIDIDNLCERCPLRTDDRL